MAPFLPIDRAEIDRRFRYYPPLDADRAGQHALAREIMRDAARKLADLVPDGREKSLAITALEEAMMWANAALARAPLHAHGEDDPTAKQLFPSTEV